MTAPMWPLAIFFILVVVLVTVILGLSSLLGERHRERTTGEPYESGILPTGSAQRRIPVKYYLVAVAFVLFDLEAVYIFAWAAAFRDLGWTGYFQVVVFIGILLAALIYFWRIGALNWVPRVWKPGQEMNRQTGQGRIEQEVPDP